MDPIDKKLIDELERLYAAIERVEQKHAHKPAGYKQLYTDRKIKKLRDKVLSAYQSHEADTKAALQALAKELAPTHPAAANMVRRL